jgi:hypothetical protein
MPEVQEVEARGPPSCGGGKGMGEALTSKEGACRMVIAASPEGDACD